MPSQPLPVLLTRFRHEVLTTNGKAAQTRLMDAVPASGAPITSGLVFCELKLINDVVNVVGSANRVGFWRKRRGDHWCENVAGSASLSGRGSNRDCRKKENGKAHTPKTIHGQNISRVKNRRQYLMNATLSDIGLAAGKGNDPDGHMTERYNCLFKRARSDLCY